MPLKRKLHEDDHDDDGSSSTSLFSDLIEHLIQTQQDSIAALVKSQKSSMSDLFNNLPDLSSSTHASPSVDSPITPKMLKVPQWSDKQQLSSYLESFEQVMMENKEPKSRWARLLRLYNSGSLLAAYNADVTPDVLDDCDAVRLHAMGDTSEEAARKWWTIQKSPEEHFNALYKRISILNNRRLEHLTNSEKDILKYITLSRFLDFLPTSCYNYAVSRKPTTGREAAILATKFFQTQTKNNHKKPFNFSYSPGSRSYLGNSREHGQLNQRGEHTPNVTGVDSFGVTRTLSGGVPSVSKNDVSLSSHVSQESNLKIFQQISSHSCGDPGHIRPNCPNKQVKRVKSPTKLCASSRECNKAFISCSINSIPCTKLLVDSACEITCISSSLVPPTCHTGKSVCGNPFELLTKAILFR